MTLTTDDLSHHISAQFNEELQNLHGAVLAMGRMVETQIIDALRALETEDASLALAVIERDPQVNTQELLLDEECGRILARRQPAAGDLRLIFAVIKAVTDLERMGDQAKHVVRSVLENDEARNRPHIPMGHLGSLVLNLMRTAMDAFARLDADLALQVAEKDRAVDKEYRATMRQLLSYMMEDPRTVGAALHLAWSARALERIGDHSKNIAEYVIYMVRGSDVRHISIEERERRLQD